MMLARFLLSNRSRLVTILKYINDNNYGASETR